MAVGIDEYKELKSQEKIELFDELFKLKAEKTKIDKRIKELEAGYKNDAIKANRDLYFALPNGIKFSIKKSIRKGALDVAAIEEATDIDCDDYRKKPSTLFTLRLDK